MQTVPIPNLSRMPLHRHREWRLIIVLSGWFVERSICGRDCFSAGDVLVRPAFVAHADTIVSEEARCLRINLSGNLARRHLDRFGWRAAKGTVPLGELLKVDHRRAIAFCEVATTGAYQANSSCELDRAAQAIAARPHVAIADHSTALNESAFTFSRKFSRHVGASPLQYRRHARLEHAMSLLVERRLSVAEVAHAAGYCDQSYFTNELRRETGLTPAKFAAAVAS